MINWTNMINHDKHYDLAWLMAYLVWSTSEVRWKHPPFDPDDRRPEVMAMVAQQTPPHRGTRTENVGFQLPVLSSKLMISSDF